MRAIRRRGIAASRSLMQPIALPLHLNNFGVGEEAIEDGRRGGDVSQKLPPVLRGTIRGDQR